MVSSIGSLSPPDAAIVDACLSLDESAAVAAGREALAAGKTAQHLYNNAKHALNRWCRRTASNVQWAGAAIPLNAVAPGVIDTPAAAYILSNPEIRAALGRMVPMRGAYPGRPDQIAAILAWCVGEDNALMTGQILFVDGGVDCSARGERMW
jgi:NAD(P)-dependent dehydrogenase (short-subunit alcohol dehydrogenase family)